ncbi:histonelysine Nmethyltransferase SETMARlike [Trichonephila clavipes]|nr:histonelysine Nmethyltransferase SETMARlike [Trichonephila clavipes]
MQFWFHRFRPSIFDVKVAPCTGKTVIENVDKITEIIEVWRIISSRSIAQKLKIDHKTVLSHLSKAELKKKLGVWVPHQLTPKNMMDRISICEALTELNEIDPFLKRMGQTLNSDLCQQLDRLKQVTEQKRPELSNRRGVVFHQDNATPHTSVVTRQKLWELGWEVLIHPPYIPDLAPNDYLPFLSLQNFLRDKK